MNYKEVNDLIEQRRLSFGMRNTKPPHLIKRTLIAPKNSHINTLVTILSFIEDDQLPNHEVLLQMGLPMNDLAGYIVYLIRGYIVILPLDDYDSIAWEMDDGSGNAS